MWIEYGAITGQGFEFSVRVDKVGYGIESAELAFHGNFNAAIGCLYVYEGTDDSAAIYQFYTTARNVAGLEGLARFLDIKGLL